MSYAPPGAVLFDCGFVTLTPQLVAANPAFYDSILNPSSSGGSRGIGSLGPLDASLFSDLRIGCSVDGMLAVPEASRQAGQQQQQQQQLVRDASSIRRAPPYTWITEAGYKVGVCIELCTLHCGMNVKATAGSTVQWYAAGLHFYFVQQPTICCAHRASSSFRPRCKRHGSGARA
jgi:hypothetical protein